jgi:hypothetical protein
MAIKRITVRVPLELYQQLVQISGEQGKSLNTLAVEALESFVIRAGGRFPLQRLSDILAPAAKAEEISEEELLDQARSIRHRIWKERYEKSVHSDEP